MKYEKIIDPVTIPYRGRFSKLETEQIRSGFSPRSMDDKWIIRFEQPYLYFNRSWTGLGVYRVELAEDLEEMAVVEATCATAMLNNSDPQHQSKVLEFLIGNLLLGLNLPFPNPKNLALEHPGLYQHVISGTGYPEKVANVKRPWWKIWR